MDVKMGRTLAATLLCGALAIGMGACGSSNGANGANGSNTADDSSQSSQTDENNGSDSGSSASGDSSDDGSAPDVTPTPADPATVNGTYEFSDFGKDCTQDCKITITVKDGMISAVMSDNFGEYPYWYGTVDADALASKGEWTSKADPDSEQGRKVAKSDFGSEDSTKDFIYNVDTKTINFDMVSFTHTTHIKAKLVQ